MIHQSIDPFIYSPLEPPSLSLSNLPKGFDLIVDGHLHIAGQEKAGNTIILFPGSTITTQLEPNEAEVEKGFYQLDLDKEIKVNPIHLANNRKFFYKQINLESGSVREQIEKAINGILSEKFTKPPLVKLKIFGKEVEVSDQELRDIERKYFGQAIVSFAKELETPEIARKIEFLKDLREQKLSVEEIGSEILKKNLEELNFEPVFDHEQAFDMLSESEAERFFNILVGEQETLAKIFKKDVEKKAGLEKWSI